MTESARRWRRGCARRSPGRRAGMPRAGRCGGSPGTPRCGATGGWVPPPESRVVMVMPPDARPEEVTSGGPPARGPLRERAAATWRGRGCGSRPSTPSSRPSGSWCSRTWATRCSRPASSPATPPEPLYERAVDQLARLRARSERDPDPGCVAFGRSFDQALYRWELDHFREWLLEAWKGATLSARRAGGGGSRLRRDRRALAAEPAGFTHRDYQSRNLMVLPGGEQVVIDFQDALLAPAPVRPRGAAPRQLRRAAPGARRPDARALPRAARGRGRAARSTRPPSGPPSTCSPCSGS